MSSSARLTTAGRSAVRARPEADNPFVLRADEDVFRVRERERQKQEEARAAQAGKKIWEKTDFSSTLSRTRKAIEELAPDVDPIALRKAKESKGLITAATAAISRDRRHEKESMADFVAKKREMFLLQVGAAFHLCIGVFDILLGFLSVWCHCVCVSFIFISSSCARCLLTSSVRKSQSSSKRPRRKRKR